MTEPTRTSTSASPGSGATPRGTTRVLIARHGEVHARWRRTVYGRLDAELSATGQEQSRRLGAALAELPLDAVVSSGLQRAEAAAAFVRAAQAPDRHLERHDDERFLELDRGDWAGRTVDQLEQEDPVGYASWMAQRGAIQAPGGESPAQVAERVLPAISHWAERHAGGTILIVAHLWVVRSAVASALGLPMERSGQLALPPGGICDFLWPVFGTGGSGQLSPLVRPILGSFGASSVQVAGEID